jgi:hypothetical protein
VKYLLVTIDVFSRYVRVRPLKNKTAKTVEKSLADILSNVNVKKIVGVIYILRSNIIE